MSCNVVMEQKIAGNIDLNDKTQQGDQGSPLNLNVYTTFCGLSSK